MAILRRFSFRAASFAIAVICASTAFAQVHVRGHYRQDGTYVRPHYRSAPDGNFSNNWSTKGNINPYTGEHGRALRRRRDTAAVNPADLETTTLRLPREAAGMTDLADISLRIPTLIAFRSLQSPRPPRCNRRRHLHRSLCRALVRPLKK